jgi:hypothetical protein
MPEADDSNGLRIGGWIPPYSPRGRAGSAPRGRRAKGDRAAPGPALAGNGPSPAGARRTARRPLLAVAGSALFALACFATTAFVAAAPEPAAPQAAPGPVIALPAPASPPVSVQPKPTAGPTRSPVASRSPRYRKISNSKPPARRRTSAPASSAAAPAPDPEPSASAAALLPAGATIGLSPVDLPGYRVRHRDFLGRVDAISEWSSRLDRADSRFVVRAGRTDARCVSFESVNYPGFFLRHRDFVIRLDQADRTALFDQDATFCPVPAGAGDAFALRSVNYPTRHVMVARQWLVLAEAAAAQATAFQRSAPL